jgi:ABC-type nitrate/sulfonate/bicarbonate transport system permease component
MRPSRVLLPVARAFSHLWGVALLLGLWELWVLVATPNSLVVVPPSAVARDIMAGPAIYLRAGAWSLSAALGGLFVGMLTGLSLAILSWSSRLLSGLLTPAAIVVSSTPVVCIIPLLTRIFGFHAFTEFATVSIMIFFPSFVFASTGLRSAPAFSDGLLRIWNTPTWRRLRLVALPAAFPLLATALRGGAAASILVAVVAEYLMQTGGLGAMLAATMQQFDIARALGASVAAMLLSTLLYAVASRVEQRIRLVFTE